MGNGDDSYREPVLSVHEHRPGGNRPDGSEYTRSGFGLCVIYMDRERLERDPPGDGRGSSDVWCGGYSTIQLTTIYYGALIRLHFFRPSSTVT